MKSMTEDQQKAVDTCVAKIEDFWIPVMAKIVERTGWTPDQVFACHILGSVQRIEAQIETVRKLYNKIVDANRESETGESWKDGPDD